MPDESKRTPRAVIWSAVLHLGIAGFLFLTTLSCTAWEHVFAALDLPAGWNPITCNRPLALRGPVIEATLVGASAAPLPPVRTKAKAAPPPPKPSKPKVTPPKPKVPPVKTLPAPPKHPDTHNQAKVVARAKEKAEHAKRVQERKEKQRMSELEARKQQAKLNKIFEQLNQAQQQSRQAARRSKLEQQKLAQLKDLKQAQQAQAPGVKPAPEARSGGNGTAVDAYKAAIQNAVTQAWLRPDNIRAGAICPIHIVQIPGGQVVSVTIEPSCPFDAAGRRSVKNAVLRAQPLPYKGFQKVFRTDITLNFKVTD